MYTEDKIKELLNHYLTPIGHHEEHGNYIDGIDDLTKVLIRVFNLPETIGDNCPECGSIDVVQKSKRGNECRKCLSIWDV